MRKLLVRLIASVLLIVVVPRGAYGSWLSDISGVDINLPKNEISLGPPRPDRIPLMLENLPKDVAFFLMNPLNPFAGTALAHLIREAKESARKVCVPVPSKIRTTLAPFFPSALFDQVCWIVVGDGQSLDAWAIRDRGMAAITLEDVIVIKNSDLGYNDSILWAHELTHVLQYRSLGVEGFATLYLYAFDALEQQARDFDQFVTRILVQRPTILNPQPRLRQYWTATSSWSTSKPISVQQYSRYAGQYVSQSQSSPGALPAKPVPSDPRSCTTTAIVRRQTPYPDRYFEITNNCGRTIRVSTFNIRNENNGQTEVRGCVRDCSVAAGALGSWGVQGILQTDTNTDFYSVTADIGW